MGVDGTVYHGLLDGFASTTCLTCEGFQEEVIFDLEFTFQTHLGLLGSEFDPEDLVYQ